MIIFDRDEFIIARIADSAEIIEIEELHGETRLIVNIPADIPEGVHAVPGNFIGLEDMDGIFQVYEINDVHTISQPERDIKVLQCDHLFYELATEKIKTLTFTSVSAGFAINQILLGTRWVAGTIDDLGLQSGATFEENPLKALYTAAELWGGELRFRLTIDGTRIVGRFVDLLVQRGELRGKRFEIGHDAKGIDVFTDFRPVRTALTGRGTGTEIDTATNETERIDFSSVVWRITNGDPADKPLGQDWVGDEDARVLYGKPDGLGFALDFNGVNQGINLGNPVAHQFAGSFTIEATFILRTTANVTILRKGVTQSGTMFLACDNRYLFVGFFHGAGVFTQLQGPRLDLNAAYHVGGSFDQAAGILRAQIKHVFTGKVDVAQVAVGTTRVANTGQNTFIGRHQDNIRFFNGVIDDVRISNVPKTFEALLAGFGRELSGTDLNLRGYWKFNESSGTTVFDASPHKNNGTLENSPGHVTGLVPVKRHIFDVHQSQAATPATLLAATWLVLGRQNKPRINIQAEVADLERVAGFAADKVRLGDTVYVIAKNVFPNVQAAARVIRIERHQQNPQQTKIELANFRQFSTEEFLQGLIEDGKRASARLGIHDRAEFFQFVGTTVEPPGTAFAYSLDIGDKAIRIFGDTFFYFDGSGLFAVNPVNLNNFWRFDQTGLRLTLDGGATFVHNLGLSFVTIGTDASFAGELRAVQGTFARLVTGLAGDRLTNFSEYPTGAAPPDFSLHGVTASQTLTVADATNVSGLKVLRHTSTLNGNRMFLWNKIPQQADILVSLRFRLTSVIGFQAGLWARIVQTDPITAYVVWVTDGNAIRIERYVNGAGVQIALTSHTFAANLWYWLEMEVAGNIVRARIWSDGSTKPVGWTIQATDSTITGLGRAAIANFQATGTRDFDVLSVGAAGARSAMGFARDAGGVSRPFMEMFDHDNRMRFNLQNDRLQFWFGGSGPVGEISALPIDAGDIFFGNAMLFRAVGSHIFFQLDSPAMFPEPMRPYVFKTGFAGEQLNCQRVALGSMQPADTLLRHRFTMEYSPSLDRIHWFGSQSFATGMGYGLVFFNSASGFWFGQTVNLESPLVLHSTMSAPNLHKLRRFAGAAQGFARGAFVQITFGSLHYSVAGSPAALSSTTNTFTLAAGTWLITCHVGLTDTVADQFLLLGLFEGATEVRRLDAKHARVNGNIALSGTTIVNLTVASTVFNFRVLASGTGTTTTVANFDRTWFEVQRLG